MGYHSFNFFNHYLLIMFRLYLFMGEDRKDLQDWVMIAQFKKPSEIMDKRNRLINQGHKPKDLEIIRLKAHT